MLNHEAEMSERTDRTDRTDRSYRDKHSIILGENSNLEKDKDKEKSCC